VSAVAKPVYTVQVRELVSFVLRRGDLGGERDFTGRDRALAGTRGHQRLQRSRPSGYQKEISLHHDIETEEFILRIRGRIDGLLTGADEILLEEIKTVQGVWDREANPLHWAQAKCYGFFYAQQNGLETITLQLTYLELETGAVTELRERQSFAELSVFFEQTSAVYLDWMREEHRWRRLRDDTIHALEFPFAYRPGQRELAVAAYRTLANGGRLFLEAPTGIGKTISVLFPAVKVMGEGKLERVFYLTARTVGRTIAEKAFADMRKAGLRIRTLTLTAKEKICVRNGQPCDATTCPLALGYYDRRKSAMRAALEREEIDRAVLETIGETHQVCPFELSLDVSSWVDAVICDYNYVFDPKVYLRRHFDEEGGDYAFLVDEAHNLVDRAREMFSADITSREIQEVRRAIKKFLPACARALTKLTSAMRTLCGSMAPAAEIADDFDAIEELNFSAPKVVSKSISQPSITSRENGIMTRSEFPAELLPPLNDALEKIEAWLAKNEPADYRADMLLLFFRLNSFRRTAELYDERFATIIESTPDVRVRLFCVDPSFLLRQALARGKSAVFFSATLAPMDYYRTLLGGEPSDTVLQLKSPFPPEHLAVLVNGRIQTHFKARAETLNEVVEAIAALVPGRRGNYLVYFPSYQYLAMAHEQFRATHPQLPTLVQRPGMSEAERDAFLAAFTVEHCETLVGFAVLGGIFGEGIDLVGERLIGAVIVGVGLPQLCVERDLIRDYFQNQTGAGFDYAYTFPGMNRVLQAIGRVIRSENDRGVALLIDARFTEARYRRLFPSWWQWIRVNHVNAIRDAVSRFWES
jgi:DNA excision repair protein ERCC-2